MSAGFLGERNRPLLLYVIYHRDVSGAELVQVPIIHADTDPLVACAPSTRTAEFLERIGVPTAPLPYRPLRHSGGVLETLRSVSRGLASALDLRRLLRAHPNRAIVYCVDLRAAMLASLAAAGLRRKVVWAVPDVLPPFPLRSATRILARLACDRAMPTSRVIASDFTGTSRALRRVTNLIYPGVALERFRVVPAPRRERRVGIIGHVSPTKRTDLALDVARCVAAETDDFELEIIGRAQYRDEDFALERALETRVANDEALRRHVRFAGYSTDVARCLERLSVLLHCRPDEPLGMVLVEAMAAGLPVVAPNSAGPTEIVEHGVSGFLYAPGDAREAARYVARLLADPDEAGRMGLAGRRIVEQRFSVARQVAETDRVLAELAAS